LNDLAIPEVDLEHFYISNRFRKKGSRSPSDARLSSEEEFIWQPLGIGLIAEAKIQASIKQGQLNNLKGRHH
jgi:hypothetical protein